MKYSSYLRISIVGSILFFISMNLYMFSNDEKSYWFLLPIGLVSFIMIVIGELGRKKFPKQRK